MKLKIGLLVTLLSLLCYSGFAQTTNQKKGSTYVPVIDQLQQGEQFTIFISSMGCFHQNYERLAISRNKGQYFAFLGDTKKTLNKEHIKAIQRFEKELQVVKNGGCTTVDTYTISYASITTKHVDGSCAWNGGRKLKKQLFPQL